MLYIRKPMLDMKYRGLKKLEGRLGIDKGIRSLRKGDTIVYMCGKAFYWAITAEPEKHDSVRAGIEQVGYKALMPQCNTADECLVAYYEMFAKADSMAKPHKYAKLLSMAEHWDSHIRQDCFMTWPDAPRDSEVSLCDVYVSIRKCVSRVMCIYECPCM